MNVDGAAVERALGRSIMPRFHAGWSLGTFTGAGLGAVAAGVGVPLSAHYAVAPAFAVAGALVASRRLLPAGEDQADAGDAAAGSAWLEPRTLAIGLMVLAFTLAEGSANDWLALGLIDGYDARHWVGVLGFALFVASMTLGRLGGPIVLDRFGRVPVLRVSALLAALGLVTMIFAPSPGLAAAGVVAWGLGSALGFPVGMSAAADDPKTAAARVSAVATIGYLAFLVGPPLVGFVGEHVGLLNALLIVLGLVAVAGIVSPAAREPRRGPARLGGSTGS
jgi:cyanate permease